MNKKLVVICGNIGVGKTTLASKIEHHLDWYVGYESVYDNPYLIDFYNDMGKWAYHLQLYFLGHRAEQHTIAYENERHAVLDRSIYEDGYVFANALYYSGKITDRDYHSYMKLFNYFIETLPHPNLLIFVKSSLGTILKRIKMRAQKFDQDLSIEYLQYIDDQYKIWINNFFLCPVLVVDSDQCNYLDDDDDFLSIVHKMNLGLGL